MTDLTVAHLLRAAAAQHANRTAVISGGGVRTYREHFERVLLLRHGLAAIGVGTDDRVAVLANSSAEFTETWHALLGGAGVIVPLNTRSTQPESGYLLRDSMPALLIADSANRVLVAALRNAGLLTAPVVWIDGSGHGNDLTYSDLLALGRAHTGIELSREPTFDDDAVLMYTGGTTGHPKGVMLSHRAVALFTMQMIAAYRMDHRSSYLAFMPMFHIGGSPQFLLPFCVGGSVVIAPGFDPDVILGLLTEFTPTHTSGVPTMYEMLLSHPRFTPAAMSSLRCLAYGGAPMPDDLLDRILAVTPEAGLLKFYGMTEVCAAATVLGHQDHRDRGARMASVGQPLPGVEVAIREPVSGTTMERGASGEICIRYPGLMTRYLNKPDATQAALRDGWYHSGDVGRIDDAGYLYVEDRLTDMVISGGENIYTLEVEAAIRLHPGVGEVAVIGVPHSLWGEAVHAVVVRAEAALTEDDVMTFAREHLPAFKAPKGVTFIEQIPTSITGKTLKKTLRGMIQQATAAT